MDPYPSDFCRGEMLTNHFIISLVFIVGANDLLLADLYDEK